MKEHFFFLLRSLIKPTDEMWPKEYLGGVFLLLRIFSLSSVTNSLVIFDLPSMKGSCNLCEFIATTVMGFEGGKAKGNPCWWQHVWYSWSHQCEPTKKHRYQILPGTDVGSIIPYYINDNLIEFSKASSVHLHLLDKISIDWIWRWETQSDPQP